MSELCFNDLHEGQKLTSSSRTMDEADMIAFARDFDPQPMHVDKEWAAQSPLGGLIASGWHTASVAMKLQQEVGLPIIGLTEIASIAWPMPVRPGDQIRVEIEILTLTPATGLVRFQNTVLNRSDKPVQIMLGAVLVPRRTDGRNEIRAGIEPSSPHTGTDTSR